MSKRTSLDPRRTRDKRSCYCIQVEQLEARILLSADSLAVVDCEPFASYGAHDDALGHGLPALVSGHAHGEPAGQQAASSASPFPLFGTFFLHSLPGADHTIFLDFDGHTTVDAMWNSGNQFVSPAFDMDGDTSSFTDDELTRIQRIWQRVMEDFIPFEIDVTTEDPGAEALTNDWQTGDDTQWGTRIVIGGSSHDWYGGSVGGISNQGSFNWSRDNPAFVFEDLLGSKEKNTAEAISHEVGHTLGLSHDGQGSGSYYSGHGSGDTGWAPIMGNSYSKNFTQWSRGEYSNPTNTQDDLAIITTNHGFGYRVDDHGDDATEATLLDLQGTSLSGVGIIERNTDVDVHSITTDAGDIQLQIDPFERGPNLDILAELYNSAGQLVATDNPADFLDATISATVPAGTYYLYVSGTGKGDPLASGYSDYGSLGQYSIAGNVSPSGAPIVDLQVTMTASSESVVAGSGADNLTYIVRVTNTGSDDASGVLVSDVLGLPDGVSIESVNPSVGSIDDAIWALGDLASGLSESLTVVLTVNASAAEGVQLIHHSASITFVNETDANLSNNLFSLSTSIAREVDLQITQTESIDPVVAGSASGNLVYIVEVTNLGPSDASGVVIGQTLDLPGGVSLDLVSPSRGVFADSTWLLGNLAGGASEFLSVVLTVDSSAVAGTEVIGNHVTVMVVNETDTNPGNDAESEATSVFPVVHVVDVLVSGTTWNPTNMALLSPFSLINRPDSAKPLPWMNTNKIDVVFDRDVEVDARSLTLAGTNFPIYSFLPDDATDSIPGQFDGFRYDSSTFTATWIVEGFIGADRLSINIAGEIGDASPVRELGGGPLLQGGFDFDLDFIVLPGDNNRNMSVSVTDLANVAGAVQPGRFNTRYDAFLDSNGDGSISVTDLVAVSNLIPSFLPAMDSPGPVIAAIVSDTVNAANDDKNSQKTGKWYLLAIERVFEQPHD